MRNQSVILVEGETEKSLFRSLNCVTNQIIIANCWQVDPGKLIRRLRRFSRKVEIFVVFDTDRLENLDRFTNCVRHLAKNCSRLYLLQQIHNLEEELIFSCDLIQNKRDLYRAFGKSSKNQFKAKFNQSNGRLEILERQGLNRNRLWSRNLINGLESLPSKKIIKRSSSTVLR